MHFTSPPPCRNHVNKDVWRFMVLNANILKNWTSVTEILIGIFSVLEEMGFDKCISQVVWKEAKELAKLRGENMKMHRVKA